MKFDIDHFYSQDEVSIWQKILGNDLHYHYGYFVAHEDLETGLCQAVRHFYDHIPSGAKVLDAGCGWGGSAQMLKDEKGCHVCGITIAQGQVEHCRKRGIEVHCLDLETDDILGSYDIVFMLEVLSHIRDKVGVLKKLRSLAPRLILTVNCIADNISTEKEYFAFGNSMVMCSESNLYSIVESAGWRIVKKGNRRFQSLRTISLWRERFRMVFGEHEPPGQLAYLKRLVDNASKNLILWMANNPLIDIIAE